MGVVVSAGTGAAALTVGLAQMLSASPYAHYWLPASTAWTTGTVPHGVPSVAGGAKLVF